MGHHQTYITGVTEGEERQKGAKRMFKEIMAQTYQVCWKTLMSTSKKQVEYTQRNPQLDTLQPKCSKTKIKSWKHQEKKQLILYKTSSIRLTSGFSSEATEARRQWDNIFTVLKEKNSQPRTKTVLLQKWRRNQDILR